MKDRKQKTYIAKVIGIIAVAVVIYAYIRYAVNCFRIMPIDSDYSNLILEASDILHGNFLMNGWTQTGISFFTTDMIYYVFAVAIKGISQETYWIASALMFVCAFFCGYILLSCGQKEKRWQEALIYIGLCAIPSELGVNLLRAHTGAYVWTFVAFALIYKILEKNKGKRVDYIFLTVLTMLGCVGDSLAIIVLVIPVLLYCCRDLLSNSCLKIKKESFVTGAVVSGVVLSFIWEKIYYAVGTADKNSFLEEKIFENFEDVPRKALVYLHSVMGLNGADFSMQHLLSVNTFFYFAKTVMVIISFGIIIYNIVNFVKKKQKDVISELLSIGFVLISIVFIITTVSVNIYSARYIGVCPIIFSILIVRFMRQKNMLMFRFANRKCVLEPFAVIICVAFFLNNIFAFIDKEQAVPEQARIVQTLENEKLTCGYGNFWDSSITTVLSNGKVRIRPISIEQNANKFRWASKDNWFDEKAQFLIIRNTEWTDKGVTYDNAIRVFGQPVKEVGFENYKILIFNYDISKKLHDE